MIICPHCGAENSPQVIFCVRCQTNVHWHKPASKEPGKPEPPVTPEESMLLERISRARAMLWVCLFILGGAALILAGIFSFARQTPDGGFLWISVMARLTTWGLLLLVPVLGVIVALQVKAKAETQLRELRERDSDDRRS